MLFGNFSCFHQSEVLGWPRNPVIQNPVNWNPELLESGILICYRLYKTGFKKKRIFD